MVRRLRLLNGSAKFERRCASTEPLTATNGRPIKFTPERLQQIRNLVERGMSREQIAETIGVTLGSLQVLSARSQLRLLRDRPLDHPRSRLVTLNSAHKSR